VEDRSQERVAETLRLQRVGHGRIDPHEGSARGRRRDPGLLGK
jgi:ribosomal protein L30/L7E